MSYNNIRDHCKLKKILKFGYGGGLSFLTLELLLAMKYGNSQDFLNTSPILPINSTELPLIDQNDPFGNKAKMAEDMKAKGFTNLTPDDLTLTKKLEINFTKSTSDNMQTKPSSEGSSGLSASQMASLGGAAVGVSNMLEGAALANANFGAQSQAIDSVVDTTATALMNSGNPYAMAAAGALKTANFLTKAGGQTVEGFEVAMENSGYEGLQKMESASSRDFAAAIGLGGIFNKGVMLKKLARRNEKARMALNAAEISADMNQEFNARQDSVENVLMRNKIALSGGIELSSLGG